MLLTTIMGMAAAPEANQPLPLPPPVIVQTLPPPIIATPLPPPVPLAVPSDVQRPEPITPPRSWIGKEDYPARAERNEEEGRTGVVLLVDKNGSVSDCEIISPSGSQDLDDATCPLLLQRARFRPAKNFRGQPTQGYYPTVVNWVIPDRVSLRPGTRISTYVVEIDGIVSDCRVLRQTGGFEENSEETDPVCENGERVTIYRDADNVPQRKRVRVTEKIEVEEP